MKSKNPDDSFGTSGSDMLEARALLISSLIESMKAISP